MDTVVNENYNDAEKGMVDDEIAANADGSEFDDSKAKFLNGGKGLEESGVDIEIASKDGDSFTGLGKEELMKYASDPFWVRTRLILFILFWVGWVGMLAAAIVIIVLAPRCPHRPDQKWWNKEVFYQVYPQSFFDGAKEDGVGDLAGVLQKQNHFENLTANVVWLNAIYESPLLDSGYDVTNHQAINSVFGTEDELKNILKQFHKKGMKVVLDFIPNHTSNKHPWFEKSRNKEGKYANYYVWASGTQGTPPNNWKSVHGGSAWEFDDVRKEFYLHQYLDFEPELNLTNPDVMEEMNTILRFWLDRGVDGFHVVGAPFLVESEDVGKNEGTTGQGSGDGYESVDHSLTANQPGNLDILNQFRQIVDSYVKKPGSERLLFATVPGSDNITQAYVDNDEKKGVHFVINNALVNRKKECNGECIRDLVDNQRNQNNWKSWTLGNQDSHRFASQVGVKYVKAMHTLLMLLPGTSVLYYGDEIGLKDAPISFNATRDPLGRAALESGYQAVSRDPYRTPMRWTGGAKAGFTTAEPWLPINTTGQPNLQEQTAHFAGYTDLEFFWELANVRKEPSIQWGVLSYSVVDQSVFSFVRHAEGFPGYLVLINFGQSPVVRTFVNKDGSELPNTAEVVAHSAGVNNDGIYALKGHPIQLQAGDVIILKI